MDDMTAVRAGAPPAARWEDFVDIFHAPREVFARRRDGRWGLVLFVLTLVLTLLSFAMQAALSPAIEAEMARAMANAPPGTAEQLEQFEGMGELAQVMGVLGFAITFPIAVILTGVVLWGVGRPLGSVATASVAIMIATYAQFPKIPQQAAAILQGLVLDARSMRGLSEVAVGPARFLDPDTASVLALGLAARFDLFLVWSTVLLAIGLHELGGLPRGRAYAAAAIVWLLGALPILVAELV